MQYKTKFLSILALLLMAVTQGAWADEVKTVLDDGVFTGFTATGGSNTGDEGYAKLVDGNTSTKWCTNSSPFYIEFHSSGLIVPTGYIMTTGGDTQSYSGRNPKSWTIKAKVNAGDAWTTLVTEENNETMPASNTTPVEFTITGNTTAYKYFRFEVSATRGDSWFQLSEFQFVGTTTDTGNFTVNPSLSGIGTSENPFTISSVADWNLFANNVNTGKRNYSGKYVKLTANITVSVTVGQRDGNPFSGIFLGDGHTITANISSTTTGTGANEQGVAPFHYINGATIKDLTVAGTIASASYHTAGLVGFADGTNLIENCTVTATLNISSNYAGGVIGHGMSSTTTIKGCVFAGTINGVDGNRENIGGIWGWGTSSPVLENCLEKGTYTNITSMHPMGLQSNKGTISGCYYLNPQVGSPSNACTVSGAAQVYTAAPSGELTKRMTLQDGNTYYALCAVSGLKSNYLYTGSPITVTPTVICGSTTLAEGTDYTYATSPATVQEKGDYTLTVTGQGDCTGAKTIQFAVIDKIPVTSDMTTLEDFAFAVNQDVTISSRITIIGNVTLYLGEGTTLTAPKGIELSQGNSLTINGPGALTINGCDSGKSGIGAVQVGTLTINGGIINVISGRNGAGIGGDKNNTVGGTITINGGVVNASSSSDGWGAGIGGGRNQKEYGAYGVCGDIIINGGQVTAIGGFDGANNQFAQGIGVGLVYWSSQSAHLSGSLTLSWSSPDDFVYSSSFASVYMGSSIGSITIADGKQFSVEGLDTPIDNTTENLADIISGKVICGYNYDRPITLADNDTYVRAGVLHVSSATYRKTLDETRKGKYQAWLVPFDYTIKAADLEKFKFYKINMIANSPRPEDEATGDVWMFVKTMAAGDVLHANMPYVYMPLEAVTDYDFTTENTVMMARNTGVIAKTETLEDIYSFYATYENTKATEADPFYYMSANGGISLGRTATVGAFRWIIRQTSKYGGTPAYARQMTIFDVDSGEVTGIVSTTDCTDSTNSDAWYDMQGRRLQGKPSRAGVYINNGIKVVIK
ncbi:MAG: discoidin domain-containing protein [Prevotella sp.]|nr:discoidin domain-containing protein [Prevotella sp.]